MSNFYSVLGDSDDEETPKLAKTATGAGANGKSGDQKKSAPAPKASGGGNKSTHNYENKYMTNIHEYDCVTPRLSYLLPTFSFYQ